MKYVVRHYMQVFRDRTVEADDEGLAEEALRDHIVRDPEWFGGVEAPWSLGDDDEFYVIGPGEEEAEE